MGVNSDLLKVGLTGVASVAVIGTALPADATTALPAAWKDCGWISDGGLSEDVSEQSSSFKPWGSTTPARKVVTESEESFGITFWETNETVLELYYRKALASLVPVGTKVTVTTGGISTVRFACVFDVVDGSDHIRIAGSNCEVTGKQSVVNKPDAIRGYPVTITFYPDDTGVAVTRLFDIAALS